MIYKGRNFKKFEVSKKARPRKHFPDPSNRNHWVSEWAVEIKFYMTSENFATTIGPLTLSDLKRLQRVVKRAIKIVQNPRLQQSNENNS